jgi:hypothetical protein
MTEMQAIFDRKLNHLKTRSITKIFNTLEVSLQRHFVPLAPVSSSNGGWPAQRYGELLHTKKRDKVSKGLDTMSIKEPGFVLS